MSGPIHGELMLNNSVLSHSSMASVFIEKDVPILYFQELDVRPSAPVIFVIKYNYHSQKQIFCKEVEFGAYKMEVNAQSVTLTCEFTGKQTIVPNAI